MSEFDVPGGCRQCGAEIPDDGCDAGKAPDPAWFQTINLTADALFFESGEYIHYFESLFEVDVRFNWCDRECFGRWLARAVVHVQPLGEVAS